MHFPSFEVHFQNDGAYTLHEAGRAILIDAHHVELRAAGSTLTYSRPVVSVDRGMSIRLSRALVDALLPHNPAGAPVEFPSGVVRLGPGGFGEVRALRRAIEESSSKQSVESRAGSRVLVAESPHRGIPRAIRLRAWRLPTETGIFAPP